MVSSREPFKFWCAPTISLERLQLELSRRSSYKVVGHQFITLTVDICVQHGEREAPRGASLSAAAETCS